MQYEGGILINGHYDIKFHGECVGHSLVETCGLYYHIRCACTFSSRKIHRINLIADNQIISLGVYLPERRPYGIETKIPKKKFQNANGFRFEIVTDDDPDILTLTAGNPVSYIERLEQLVFNGDILCEVPTQR